MHYLLRATISGAALMFALPAVAQVGAPTGVYHGNGPAPAPGGMAYAPPQQATNGAPYGPPPMALPNVPQQMRMQGGPDMRRQNGPDMRRPAMPDMRGPNGAESTDRRVWQNGRWTSLPPSSPNTAYRVDPHRWGYSNGRWDGGNRAPGGWDAYRRLNRGHRIPQYWLGGTFGIPDYLSYGLAAPPLGYRWVRYYDDAVLIDAQGDVWDSVGGIGWMGGGIYDDGYSGSRTTSYSYSSGPAYVQPIQPVDPNVYYAQPGYQGGQAYGYGYGYDGGYSSGYQQGGYYYAAPMTYTTTYVTAPITTTTVVEEVIEESARTYYSRAAPRRVVRKAAAKRYRAKPRCVCR